MSYDKNKFHFVVATCILVKDGKYLIAKRADWEKAFPGKWTVPGGKLEVLDYALKQKDTSSHWYNVVEKLLRREVLEEVGLEIKEISYLTSLTFIRSDEIPVVVLSYYSEPVAENPLVVLDNSLTDYKWVTLEEAKNYELIEGIYEELEMLDKKLKIGTMDEWQAGINASSADTSNEWKKKDFQNY